MEEVQRFFNDLLEWMREGFTTANGVLGLIIAVVAVFMIGRYSPRTILTTTIGATVAYLIVRILVPVLDHDAPLRLPDVLSEGFWRETGILALGLFVVITALFVVKKLVVRGGGGH